MSDDRPLFRPLGRDAKKGKEVIKRVGWEIFEREETVLRKIIQKSNLLKL